MIILKPGDNLLAIMTADGDYYISYVDLKGFESGNSMGSLTTAGGETIVLYSPTEGVRQVKYMSFRSSSAATFSLLFRTNTGQGITKKVFFQCNTAAGDVVEYTNDEGFRVKDINGNLKVTTGTGGGGAMNISAGTTSNNLTNVVFSNSNNVSFGLNGSTVTASVNAGGNLNLSAGTTSNDLTNVFFRNSNGITFGLNASTVTASHNGITTQTREAFSAQGGSSTFQTLVFTNSNGISFSNTNGSIWGSHNGLTSQSNQALSGSNGSFTFQTATFGDLNGLSFYTSNGSMVGSYTVPTVTNSSWTASAGTTSNTISGLTFSNSNSVNFGLNNGVITAEYIHANTQNLYAVGNTTNSSSVNLDNRNVTFFGGGIVSVGYSNSSVLISATAPAVTNSSWTVSDNVTSATVGRLAFTNSNGITMTLSTSNNGNHTLIASHNGLTSQSNQNVTAGNGGFAFQTLSFSNVNGISFGTSAGSAITASHNAITTARASTDAIGLNTAQTNVTWTVNSAGLSLNAGGYAGTVTAATNATFTLNSNGLSLSVAAPGGGGAVNFSAGTTSNNLQSVVFATGNGITFGLGTGASSQSITASYNSTQFAGTGTSATNASITLNSNGLAISVAAPGGGAGGTATMWQPFNEGVNVIGQRGQNSWALAPLPTPPTAAGGIVSIDRIAFPILVTNSSNSTGSMTLTMFYGLYTKNGSSLSLAHSTTGSLAVTFSGTIGNSTYAGVRLMTIPWTTTFGDDRYYVAVASRTTTGGGNCSVSQMLISQINSNFSGLYGVNSNRSNQWPIGWGNFSSASTNFPNPIPISQIDGTASLAARPPSWFMINDTV